MLGQLPTVSLLFGFRHSLVGSSVRYSIQSGLIISQSCIGGLVRFRCGLCILCLGFLVQGFRHGFCCLGRTGYGVHDGTGNVRNPYGTTASRTPNGASFGNLAPARVTGIQLRHVFFQIGLSPFGSPFFQVTAYHGRRFIRCNGSGFGDQTGCYFYQRIAGQFSSGQCGFQVLCGRSYYPFADRFG